MQLGHAQLAHAEHTASNVPIDSSAEQMHHFWSARVVLLQLPHAIQAAVQYRDQAVQVAKAYGEYASCLLASTSEEADETKLCAAR